MNLDDKAKDNTTRIAIHGLSGTGKSTLMSKLASNYFLHWITLENDSDILLKLPREQWKNINLIEIPDSAVFPVGCDTLIKLFRAGTGNICHKHGIFECGICKKKSPEAFSFIDLTKMNPQKDIVCIDSGSQLSQSILAHTTKGQPVDYKPEWDDWGSIRKISEFFASEFQASAYNLVVTFHSIEAELEDGRKKLVPAFGSKDFSSKIAKAFSHVVYTDVKNREHVAYSDSKFSNSVLTKSRTDFCIESLEVPSLIPLFLENEINSDESNPYSQGGYKAVVAERPSTNIIQDTKGEHKQSQGAKVSLTDLKAKLLNKGT